MIEIIVLIVAPVQAVVLLAFGWVHLRALRAQGGVLATIEHRDALDVAIAVRKAGRLDACSFARSQVSARSQAMLPRQRGETYDQAVERLYDRIEASLKGQRG